MSGMEHIVVADSDGNFYCRAVDSVLNYKKDQHVCGRGCPCFVRSAEGQFVCFYEEEGMEHKPALFPSVPGLAPGLQRTYAFAARAHRQQYRKGTKIPYFTHIITTVNYILKLTDDLEILQAAILHDTVEDTPTTVADLKRDFGDRVAALVEAATEDKRHDMPASETWEIRKEETVARLKSQTPDVKMIVLADKTANAESLVKEWNCMGDEVWKKFNQKDKKKQEWYFRAVREQLRELDGTDVMKQLDVYIEMLFG